MNTSRFTFDAPASGPLMSFENLQAYYDSFQKSQVRTNLELYENYYMYNRWRYAELVKEKDTWRTNIKSPLSHMFLNNVYNMFIDWDQTFNVIVRNPEKYEDNRVTDDILERGNYLISHTNSTMQEEIFSSCFDAIGLWTWVHSPYYVNKSFTSKRLNRDWGDEEMLVEHDFPSCRYVSPFNNLEIGSSFLWAARLHVERELVPFFQLESYFAPYGITIKRRELEANSRYLDTKDWESIKKNMAFYNYNGPADITMDDTFSIANKMAECFRVTDGIRTSLWINSVYHGTFDTIWPRKEIPYIKNTFKKIPWHTDWLGILYLVRPMQEAFDTILNYRIDNVKLSLNKMFFADPSFNMFGNWDRIRIKPGKVIKVSSPDAIKEFKMSDVNQSAYQETEAMFGMVQAMTGISAPSLGIQSKVERVSWGPELYKASADAQLNQFTRNYARTMAKTMKFMMIYTLTNTKKETLDKVLGVWNAFWDMDMRDLISDFDFDFDVRNDKLDTQAVKRNQVLQAIQTWMQPGADWKPLFPEKLTKDLTKAWLKTYNLDIDLSSLDEDQAAKMMWDMDWMQHAVEWAVANQQEPMKPAMKMPNPEAMMRDLQQQWAGWVPWEMTTNPTGINS